jgi:hypothetical protein
MGYRETNKKLKKNEEKEDGKGMRKKRNEKRGRRTSTRLDKDDDEQNEDGRRVRKNKRTTPENLKGWRTPSKDS